VQVSALDMLIWLDNRERSEARLRELRLAMVASGGTAADEEFPEMFAPREVDIENKVDFAQLEQVEDYTPEAAMDDWARLASAMADDVVTLGGGPDPAAVATAMTGQVDESRGEWL
jgi:hypothetical protein